MKTYSKSVGRAGSSEDHVRGSSRDHVQVKIEPHESSNGAFSFDDVADEHVAKRPCVTTSLG